MLLLHLQSCALALLAPKLPAVGAIRWDAWYGARDATGAYVQAQLSIPEWRYRLPFFARETRAANGTVVSISTDGNSSATMARELAYAAAHGIDFWAFVAYSPSSSMFYAQRLYLQQAQQAAAAGGAVKVNFSLIMDGNELTVLANDLPRIVEYFQLPYYQRAPGGRPLIFTFGVSNASAVAPSLAALRRATLAAGLPSPYIVAMGWGSVMAQATAAGALGVDAISQYAFVDGQYTAHPGTPTPYAHNAALERQHHADCASSGTALVPTVTAGWDPRPREARPPPWQHKSKPACNSSAGQGICWVQDPTMPELTEQTRAVVAWAAATTEAQQSGAVVISAWNEHDEGHWICPSLQDGPAKLQAVLAGIQKAKALTALKLDDGEEFVRPDALVHVADCAADPDGALHAAVLAVRAARRGLMAPGPPPRATIAVRGRCRLRRPLQLSAADGNTVWTSAAAGAGRGAVISGGVGVGGWRAGPGAALAAPLPTALRSACPRQLYVDDNYTAYTNARNASDIFGAPALNQSVATADGVLVLPRAAAAAAVAALRGRENVELVHDGAYQQSRCALRTVALLSNGSAILRFAQPCWRLGLTIGQMSVHASVKGVAKPVMLLNARREEELRPGEFYCSLADARLSYVPRSAAERASLLASASASAAAVVAPLAPALLQVVGARGLRFDGLTFAHTAFDAPSTNEGYLERYGGVQYKTCNASSTADSRPCFASAADACAAGCCAAAALGGCALTMAPAAVAVRRSSAVTLTNCSFTNLGAWGVSMSEGTVDSAVRGCAFSRIQGGGAFIGDVNETRLALPPALRTRRVAVADNTLVDIGEEYRGSSAVHLFAATDSAIEHNRVRRTGYTAFTFVWPAPQNESWSSNLSLVANDASLYSRWGTDGGAVHTLSLCEGCVLDRNYFHHQECCGSKVTYVDNDSTGYTVKNHVVDDTGTALWLFYQQKCAPTCPWIKGEHAYDGCNSTANHAKCCCSAGSDNHACPAGAPCYVRDAAADPFPIQNITSLVRLKHAQPWPAAAQAIIDVSGPRPLRTLDDEVARVAGRQAALFVCCSFSAAQWKAHVQGVTAHRANLTSVIVAPYELSKNATLINQGTQQQVAAAVAAAAELRALGLRTTALVACNPSGVRVAMYDSAVASAFISQAVAALAATGLQGYNLDAEFPGDGNHSDGAAFVSFLDDFSRALTAENASYSLSVDVHGDGSTPFDFHVWGPAYAASAIDHVITMATYTDAKKNFDKLFAEATSVIGADKMQPGMEPNAVLSNPLDIGYILSKNVSAIAVWGPTPDALKQVHWDMIGLFLTQRSASRTALKLDDGEVPTTKWPAASPVSRLATAS